jgi:hypothetical protein
MFEISKLTGNIYFNDILVPQDDTHPMWQAWFDHVENGGEVTEVESKPEEITQEQQAKAIAQAKQFLANNETAGREYYSDIHLRVTVALFAVERATLFPILQEVDALLYPPLNKIKTGDFASALYIFSNQQPPTKEFVLNFYNEAVSVCQNYYDTKYPK